jgi:pimeloyl-ACP methyl ester carboxylesterase
VTELVRTPDGRTLAVESYGDPAGKAVLVLMGTPNSRLLYGPTVADAAARGLRLISYDRPGYGRSTRQPGLSIADAAADVSAICEALHIGDLVVWGLSGGGPPALACAALLPQIVTAAASLASPAPFDADGLDYFAGMGEENVEEIKLSITDPTAAQARVEADRAGMLAITPDQLASLMPTLLSPVDAAVLDAPLAEYLVAAGRDGLSPGGQGWWDENLALVRPWGFSVSQIRIPVLLLHGYEDRFVPVGHGRWLAAQIPGVDARLLPNDGHLTLLQNRVGEVHEWLISHS